MKKALKWVLIGIGSFFALIALIVLISKPSETEMINRSFVTHEKLKLQLDSTIAEIKGEKDFTIDSILYLKDSTLQVHINTSNDIAATYFDVMYDVLKIGNVLEIEVFKNKQLVSSTGFHSGKKIENFNKQFVSSWDGSCRPVEQYIKKTMNDPSSYKHESSKINLLLSGNFEVSTRFRGKNSFGSVVLNNATAEVSKDGIVLSFSIE